MAEKVAEKMDEAKILRCQEKNVESERMDSESLKTPMRKSDSEKKKLTQQISAEKEKLKTEKEKFEREKIELHKIAERIEAERKRLDSEKKSKNEHENKQKRDEFETEKKESNEDKESEKKRLRSEEDSERKRTKLELIRVESEKRKLELEKVEKERLLREDSDDVANVEEETEKKIKQRKTEPNKTTNENELLRKEAKVTLNRICPEPYLGKQPLKKDFQQTTSKKFIKCKLCTKIVITKSYQEHLAKSHDITDNYEDLDLHSAVEKESPPECEKCGEQLGDGELLKTHMCKQSPAKQQSLKLMCDKCKKKFKEERYLRMHLRMNTMCKTD